MTSPETEPDLAPAGKQPMPEARPRKPPGPVDFVFGGLATTAVGGAWAVLVALRPGTTFHFAPLLAPAVGPVVMRMRARGPLSIRWAAASAGTGVALTGLVGIVLLAAGDLNGPTLWAAARAPLEGVAFATLGGLWGWRLGSRKRPGLLFGHERAPVAVR